MVFPAILALGMTAGAGAQEATPVLLDAMTTELQRAFTSLGKTGPAGAETKDSEKQLPPYFLSYSVADASYVTIRAQFGALVDSGSNHMRVADVQVRLGEPKLDNTHGSHRGSAVNSVQLPLTDDRNALTRALWLATNSGYGNAVDNYLRVKTEAEVRAKEEDSSPDFSKETPQIHIGKVAPLAAVDRAVWEKRVSGLSKIFREYPDVYQNVVMLTVQNETDYFASSEGSRVAAPHLQARLVVFAVTRAEDGMDLFRAQTFEAETVEGLPAQPAMEAAMRELGKSLEELRKAPMTEPFDGPVILSGRAAAVFFHEVLGHRLEGQRQRGDEEGQTFTKELGKEVLPKFLSVMDDPTQTKFGGEWLSGSYEYDDEGRKAQRVDLIKDGVLKTFLMSRLPIASFSKSNGHGRAQTGRMPTGRQGNLIVTSTKTETEDKLRKELIEEAKKQGKAYGLYFEDISSGFAVTTRSSPQAFQVIPLVVWRVYVDGRPDELVRGVSIVGTPLAAMKRIVATSDKSEVFNGECGAESGTVPVSAVAPAMLLSEMETQRQPQGTARPPILAIPREQGTRNQGTKRTRAGNRGYRGRAAMKGKIPVCLIVAATILAFVPGPVHLRAAAQPTRADAEKDPVLKAMLTELDRSMSQLQLKGFEKPFFILYRIEDVDDFETKAEFGAKLGVDHSHQRVARVTVRVGDYKIDSSGGRGEGSLQLAALDSDPIAVRSALWAGTDIAYKNALAAYAQKQAALKQVQSPPQADDFSKEKPVIVLGDPAHLSLDEKTWTDRVALDSGVYYTDSTLKATEQDVQYSSASFHARVTTTWMVNSEGTIVRKAEAAYQEAVAVGTQAADGMRIDRSYASTGVSLKDLDGPEEFRKHTVSLIASLADLRKAPVVEEEYHGPVLFSADAATETMRTLLSNGLTATRPKMGTEVRTNGPFASSLHSRVMPEFLDVVDDPELRSFEGKGAVGAYSVDDEGVPAQAVKLITAGKLESYLIGRVPVRDFPQSNGHGRAGITRPALPTIGVLEVKAREGLPDAELERKLLDLGKDRGLKSVYEVETMGPEMTPRLLYRVAPDGKRELVRGGTLADLDQRALRSGVVAAGKDLWMANYFEDIPQTVLAPALLLEDVTVRRTSDKNEKLPFYPPPQ